MNNSFFDLSGHVIAVLGGTGVLGEAIISQLINHGAAVALVSRTEHKAQAVIDKVVKINPVFSDKNTGIYSYIGENGDTLSDEALYKLANGIHNKFGIITDLICLVGGNRKETVVTPDADPLGIPYEEFKKTFDLNFRDGIYNPISIFGRKMIAELDKHDKDISIITTSSMAAITPLSRVGAYGVAKAALENYTEWLAGELGSRYGDRVRINCVTPGFIVADQNRNLLIDPENKLTARGQQIISHTPFKRFGTPQDIASAFVYLIGSGAKFINGQSIVLDGGFSKTTI